MHFPFAQVCVREGAGTRRVGDPFQPAPQRAATAAQKGLTWRLKANLPPAELGRWRGTRAVRPGPGPRALGRAPLRSSF